MGVDTARRIVPEQASPGQEEAQVQDLIKQGFREESVRRVIAAERRVEAQIVELARLAEVDTSKLEVSEVKKLFIKFLVITGKVTDACHKLGISTSLPAYWRKTDKVIDQALQDNESVRRNMAMWHIDDLLDGTERILHPSQAMLAIWRANGGKQRGIGAVTIRIVEEGKEGKRGIELQIPVVDTGELLTDGN